MLKCEKNGYLLEAPIQVLSKSAQFFFDIINEG